ncbi:hypothetical protein VNO80_14975 [Phaseolus coccineus]|uniref:Uncharacterized protein n=1 Tax=Phaseolus coccineus TaxID=3886 RepID=A0AAN9QYW2_PHACN
MIQIETLEFPISTLTYSDTSHHNELRTHVGPTQTRAWTSRAHFGAYDITSLAPRFQTTRGERVKEGLFQSFPSYTHHLIPITGSVGQGL